MNARRKKLKKLKPLGYFKAKAACLAEYAPEVPNAEHIYNRAYMNGFIAGKNQARKSFALQLMKKLEL